MLDKRVNYPFISETNSTKIEVLKYEYIVA